MKREKLISVLIPCYNEEKTVGRVVSDFKKVLPEAVIYVFDNNSSDGSVKVAQKANATIKTVKYQGKGNVVREMFRTVDSDVYIMVDADNTYDASDAKKMVDMVINGGVDMTAAGIQFKGVVGDEKTITS